MTGLLLAALMLLSAVFVVAGLMGFSRPARPDQPGEVLAVSG